MNYIISDYVYSEPSTTNSHAMLGHVYSEPSAIRSQAIFIHDWSDPSETQTLEISSSTVTQPASGHIYYNRTLVVALSFPSNVKVKAALSDLSYDAMPFILADTATNEIYTTITLPMNAMGEQTLYIKTVDADNNPMPYMRSVTFHMGPAPIGPDTPKLLRLRKFSHDNLLKRWHGKTSFLLQAE
jgi:hypothetical protein